MALTLVAAYDVSEDGRRARLAALLQAYGDRIQKSVFIIMVDDAELAVIGQRARDIIDLDTDSLWMMRQCGACWDDAITIGQTNPPSKALYWAVL